MLRVVDEWRASKYLLVTAPSIISEIRRILTTPRIKKKYRIGEEEIEQLIDLLKKVAVVIPGSPGVKGVIPRDPTDDKFLSCAIEAGPDFIVSGDRYRLDLGDRLGIPIITVQEFLKKLSASI